MTLPRRSPNPKQSALTIGTLAEALVAQWLTQQGWDILDRRWHCRWGELDLVVRSPKEPQTTLAFVEVKARSRKNWDADGLLAITPQKQAKLWQTAHLFLAGHPHLADLPCRFDVAIVCCRATQRASPQISSVQGSTAALPIATPVNLGQPVAIAGYHLTLKHYIPAAFD